MFLFSCVCNIWIDVKPFRFSFFFPSAGGPSMYCELVQRSGHSTCGYHGWSPWRTCCLCCSCGKGLSREPQQQNFGFTRLSQSEIFFGVVFNLWAWYFFSHSQGLSREPYSDYFQLFGLFFGGASGRDCLFGAPPIIRFIFFNYCFQICTWGDSVPDGSIIDPFLSSVCLCAWHVAREKHQAASFV